MSKEENMENLSHNDLIESGYKWCLSRCGFVFKELVAHTITGEIPDVIGFRNDYTFLLEAKTNRSDFNADAKKVFRKAPELGMGDFRFFITPRGLVKRDELPEGWGLIEVSNTRYKKARVIYNPFGKGNIYSNWIRCKKNERTERALMYSALRRLQIRNRIEEIYNKI